MKRASKRSGRIAKPVALAQQLDKAVEKIMSDRESKPPRVNSRIAAILRIASDLRDLPNEDFKAQLKKDLVSRVTPAGAPEGYHSITPYLQVEGAAKLIEFLRSAFGAEEIFRVPRGDEIAHAQLKLEDSMIEVADAIDQYQPNPTAIWLFVKDADAVYKRALEAGAISIDEPVDQDYGDRYAGVKDPFGNVWYLATHLRDFTIPAEPPAPPAAEPQASEVAPHQRPGSIMPFMYIDDAARAFEFYKKVFRATELHRITQPDGKVSHVQMAIGDTHVMLRDANTRDLAKATFTGSPKALGRTTLPLYLYVDDADATFSRALAEGSKIVDPMEDKEWGHRCGGVQDPFGHIWYIATPLKSASH
jgi:PhnB protein